MGKWLFTLGLILAAAGLLWPWLSRLGLGSLPGDIRVVRGDKIFYFPLTSSILASLALSLILWLLRK